MNKLYHNKIDDLNPQKTNVQTKALIASQRNKIKSFRKHHYFIQSHCQTKVPL